MIAFAWTFIVAFGAFKLIDGVIGFRVSHEEETQGLDIGEHGSTAYPDYLATCS